MLCDVAENNQVIYTTHSKKFVNVFVPESIVRLSNLDGLGTKMVYKDGPQINWPAEIDGFSIKSPGDIGKYLRTLEPNIGNLAFAKKVIIVEGPHDVLAYRTIIETELNLGVPRTLQLLRHGARTRLRCSCNCATVSAFLTS